MSLSIIPAGDHRQGINHVASLHAKETAAMGRFMRGQLGGRMAPQIPPLLRRANQLMSSGDFAGAATALEQLARAAEARGGPRAPFFYIQSGRARVMAGQAPAALESLERGLGLFAARGQFGRVTNFGTRLVAELNQKGLTKEAAEINGYMKTLVPNWSGGGGPGSGKRALLPASCPGCGAPVHPDDVEWIDELTAACAYCGTPVRGK